MKVSISKHQASRQMRKNKGLQLRLVEIKYHAVMIMYNQGQVRGVLTAV